MYYIMSLLWYRGYVRSMYGERNTMYGILGTGMVDYEQLLSARSMTVRLEWLAASFVRQFVSQHVESPRQHITPAETTLNGQKNMPMISSIHWPTNRPTIITLILSSYQTCGHQDLLLGILGHPAFSHLLQSDQSAMLILQAPLW